MTFVTLYGIDHSRRFADEHTAKALAELNRLPGDKNFLHALITNMVARSS